MLNKIDYLVIYSIKNEDLVFQDKDNSDKIEDDDTVVSFYFLFKDIFEYYLNFVYLL